MYIVEFSKKVIKDTLIENEQQKIDYIRGYFDAEGSTSRKENVRFYIYTSLRKIKVILNS
jgi:hypothetical protein